MRITLTLLALITLVGCAPAPEEAPVSELTEEMVLAPEPETNIEAEVEAEVALEVTEEIPVEGALEHQEIMAMALEAQSEESIEVPAHGDNLGFWVRLTYDEETDARMWDELVEAGATDLFVETFYHGFVIYPGSNLFAQRPELEGTDPLRWAIDAAHERGIRLHCWVHTLRWGVNYREYPEIPVSPLMELASNEDWFVRLEDGGFSNIPFVSPANRGVQDLAARLSLDLSTRYPDIDGINLDYIRWPAVGGEADSTAWYDRANLTTFMMEGNPDPRENASAEIVAAFRQHSADHVTNIVKITNTLLSSLHPTIKLTAAFFPGNDEGDAYHKAQDWRQWIEEGLIDIATPMCYSYAVDGVVEEVKAVEELAAANDMPVWAGLAVKADTDHASAVEQFEAVQGLGLEGAVIFSHGWVAEQPSEFAEIGDWLEENDL